MVVPSSGFHVYGSRLNRSFARSTSFFMLSTLLLGEGSIHFLWIVFASFNLALKGSFLGIVVVTTTTTTAVSVIASLALIPTIIIAVITPLMKWNSLADEILHLFFCALTVATFWIPKTWERWVVQIVKSLKAANPDFIKRTKNHWCCSDTSLRNNLSLVCHYASPKYVCAQTTCGCVFSKS